MKIGMTLWLKSGTSVKMNKIGWINKKKKKLKGKNKKKYLPRILKEKHRNSQQLLLQRLNMYLKIQMKQQILLLKNN
jgi:hypothetical protein